MRDFWRSFIEMFMFMFLKSTHLEVCRFENCLEWSQNNFIFCKEQKKENLSIGIVIGPEGGFDANEIEKMKNFGAQVVTLGKRILRTETVALAMVSVIMYELGGNI